MFSPRSGRRPLVLAFQNLQLEGELRHLHGRKVDVDAVDVVQEDPLPLGGR